MDGIDKEVVLIKPLADWPGYAVDEKGQVLTSKITGARGRVGNQWRALKPAPCQRGGYLEVRLSREGVTKKLKVHILVASQFLGDRPVQMQVRHKDGNPENNLVSNLAYGTALENGIDAVAHGSHYRDNKGVLTSLQVLDIKNRLSRGEKQSVIAHDFGVAQMTVSDIKTGRSWSHLDGKCGTVGCVSWME